MNKMKKAEKVAKVEVKRMEKKVEMVDKETMENKYEK